MPISFHCECCKKKITAPDNAGGKWGKCPACNHRCYIPMPKSDDEEELKLAPIDQNDEKEYERMMRETRNLTGSLLHQTDIPPEADGDIMVSEKELTLLIIRYLAQMADGQLDEAKRTAERIIPCGGRAKAILENILQSEQPEPELANVPKKVLVGFVRNILSKMKQILEAASVAVVMGGGPAYMHIHEVMDALEALEK